jgi:hypothetical protein
MKSTTLPIYHSWLETASALEIARVDDIYYACERNYNVGGDVVVETMSPAEIAQEFLHEGLDWGQVMAKVRGFCNLHTEQANNCRWGEDSDLKTYWTEEENNQP